MRQDDLESIILSLSEKDFLDNFNHSESASLYLGSMGVAIHYSWLYNYTKEPIYKHQAYDLISSSINNLNSLDGKSSLSGYAGILWGIVHLININLLSYNETKTIIIELKRLILDSISQDISDHNFDLMHGLIGKLIALQVVYELAPLDQNDLPPIIENSISELIEMATADNISLTVFWQNAFYRKGIINTGMAHGVAGIIWFLTNMSNQPFLTSSIRTKCVLYAKNAANWLILQKTNSPNDHFCIPCDIDLSNNNQSNRFSLAWCHGDLGIASALIGAGKTFKDEKLSIEGVDIAKRIAQLEYQNSTILQDESFIDCSLCHGTFGAFFMFYQLYQWTGEASLKKAYSYWLDLSLKSIQNGDNLRGLKTAVISPDQKIIWQQNISLLNGVTGTTLILLTYIMQEQGMDLTHPWFSIFI
ncbi:MAG TPA: hypothetical protein DCS93_42910 [Microscillaceae bacterium]|nr:hypothetical protein [Microscillaceae bacterium]